MSASSLFLSPTDARIDTRYVSPLSAPLNTNGFPITNASSVSASEVLTEQIALPTGSLQTKIAIGDSIEVAGSIKATAIPAAGSAYPNVLGYNTATGAIEYQAAGGGGGGGGNAYGTFAYSATTPHPVDSWYNNTATNIAFSNTGSASNQSWLGALQAALQSLQDVFIQVVQGSLVQSLKVVSVSPDTGFTYVEYLTATIPPMWVDGAATNFYYALEQTGALTNPLTANLDAGGNDIGGIDTVEAVNVRTNGIALPVVGAAPAIDISSPVVFTDPTLPAQFTLPPQTAVAPTVGNDLVNKTYADGLVGGLVANPMTSSLNAGGYNITNIGNLAATTATVSTAPSVGNDVVNKTYADGLVGGLVANPMTASLNAGGYNITNIGNLAATTATVSTPPSAGNDVTNKAYVDALTVNLAGLYNTLRIVPTAVGQTVTARQFTTLPSPYSSWIPDATPNTLINPVAGTGNSWRLTKSPGGAGTRWWVWPYNPQWNLSPPFSAPSVTFNKTNLNALYALIRIKTANIATQGAFFFNIYTYDYATPPASPQAFSSRFDYSLNNLALPLTTGALALQNEFVYLVYACDAPKIVATPSVLTTITQANGQTPGQQTSQMLRDPFDIHPTVPHIPMSAVAVTNGVVVPSDINQVPVLSLVFGCTSSAITAGVDMEVLSVGYKANGGAINVEYSLQYS